MLILKINLIKDYYNFFYYTLLTLYFKNCKINQDVDDFKNRNNIFKINYFAYIKKEI
ncbi:hypothetical protein SDAV_00548 [Spiroplasma phoeniceum P40]|uniref:Uncharacterized protein n=1 Tax=Spiroplasma phoeniceum P40 TaxID=1276259 RepID=A0A345DMV4_9MOLU|nr:hypothetical protein SDAV_00548 [Spiroplasma phoeniceum P40]